MLRKRDENAMHDELLTAKYEYMNFTDYCTSTFTNKLLA